MLAKFLIRTLKPRMGNSLHTWVTITENLG